MKVEEINKLLKVENLGFPEYRKEIGSSGHNYAWVKKALAKSGLGSPKLRELLDL